MSTSGASREHVFDNKLCARALRERFQLLVESVKDYAIYSLDRQGIVTTWNSGAERIKGYTANEIIGKHVSRFYPEEDVRAGRCEMELATAAEVGRYEHEGWRVRKDGSRFWANVVISTLRSPSGDILGFAKVTRDLTERRIAEQERIRLAQINAAREEAQASLRRLTRLQLLNGALAAALRYEELAAVILEKGLEALDAASGGFVRPRGDLLETVATKNVSEERSRPFALFPTTLRIPLAMAFRSRSPEWVETREEFLARYPDCPKKVGASAACALPLVLGDRVLGVMGFRFAEPRTFTALERAFMGTFATQAAQALDRAEIYEREVLNRQRLEALADLAEGLSSALTTEDIARVLADRGRRAESADTCMVYTFDERTKALELAGGYGCHPEIVERLRRITPESNARYEDFARGEALWIETPEEYEAFFPDLARAQLEGGRANAFWMFPLVAEGKRVGLLAMGFHKARRFPPEEREFVQTFARHCAEALLRARRLEAERAARAMAERAQASLAATLRSIGDAVVATDVNGRVTIMNQVAEDLTGWSEAEARGRPVDEVFRIVDGRSRESVPSPLDAMLEQGSAGGAMNSAVLVRRDGRRHISIDESGAPIRRADGVIEGSVLVFRDVTQNKREAARRALLEETTAALAESLDYEVTLAKVAQLAVPRLADWCAVDLLEERSLVAGASKRVAVAHVDPAKVAVARELHLKYPPKPNARSGIGSVLRTGRSELYPEILEEKLRDLAIEDEHLRISQALKLRSVMVVPLVSRGRTLGAMTYAWAESGHTYTKTDLEFAEELGRRCAVAIDNALLYAGEQRARQSADVANRAKDEFLAMVSHELRTPLNAIIGWAKMMTSSTIDGPKRRRALETIERNAVAMAQLIEDLLDISRIISGKMRLDVQRVDIALVIGAAIESVRPAADAKEIRINSTLDASHTMLTGDPTRLQQVVWNLLSNAVKFTPKGGWIELLLRSSESDLEIVVADSGKGIDPRFLPYVFDPFRQEDASHTRSRGGLGLGLAITRQLVELHGGRIEAHSEGEGRGATFIVRFPEPTAPLTKDDGASSTRQLRLDASFDHPAQLRGLRALVVEDEEDSRLLVKTVLEECGCHVRVAASAEDAMAAFAAEVPDVLLSDVGMPAQDGYDLIRRIRALPPDEGGEVPAAALTAYARAEDRRRALRAGYSIHIPKPVEPAELVTVVASLTRTRRR